METGRVADERRPAGEQLVEHAAGGVEVGAGVDGAALRLLGREVLRGADDRLRLGHRGAVSAMARAMPKSITLIVAVGR